MFRFTLTDYSGALDDDGENVTHDPFARVDRLTREGTMAECENHVSTFVMWFVRHYSNTNRPVCVAESGTGEVTVTMMPRDDGMVTSEGHVLATMRVSTIDEWED